jgi:hypothetical protein
VATTASPRRSGDAGPSGRARSPLLYSAGCLGAGAIAGIPAGWAWTQLASPPAGVLTSSGVVLGETELNQEVGVTMWFLLTGVTVGLLLGFLSAWRGSRYGVTAVLAVVAACFLGSLVSYWTGVHLFGPDAKAQLASAKVGQHVTTPVSVGTKIAFLGWPVGGLFGVLGAISWWPGGKQRRAGSRLTGSALPH